MASNSVGTLHDGAYVVSVTTGPSNQPGRITTASTYSTKPASSTYHSIVSGTIVSSDTTVLANSSELHLTIPATFNQHCTITSGFQTGQK